MERKHLDTAVIFDSKGELFLPAIDLVGLHFMDYISGRIYLIFYKGREMFVTCQSQGKVSTGFLMIH